MWGQAAVGRAVTPGCSTWTSEVVVSSRLMNHTITAMICVLPWQQACPLGTSGFLLLLLLLPSKPTLPCGTIPQAEDSGSTVPDQLSSPERQLLSITSPAPHPLSPASDEFTQLLLAPESASS